MGYYKETRILKIEVDPELFEAYKFYHALHKIRDKEIVKGILNIKAIDKATKNVENKYIERNAIPYESQKFINYFHSIISGKEEPIISIDDLPDA